MARRRKGRAVDGILLLDKPQGDSSNGVLQRAKRIYFAQKAGHTGALDPLATGLLPVCFGEGTKFSQFLLDTDKTYLVRAKLGERTTTSDADGEVVQTRAIDITQDVLLAEMAKLTGDIEQVPSMYSALKYQGQPLYKYAREGIEVPRESRPITIFKFELRELGDDWFEAEVHCSKGTYIRTLVDDLGEALGCGAHVTMLRRTQVGPFKLEQCHTLESLEDLLEQAKAQEIEPKEKLDPLLLPMNWALDGIPKVELDADSAHYAGFGNAVFVPNAPDNGWVQIFDHQGEFMGVGEIAKDGKVQPKRMVQKPDASQ